MEILKNFKALEERFEEFPLIKLLPGEDVFVELPICRVDFNSTIKNPVLFIQEGQIPKAMEQEELKKLLTGTKRFFLTVNDKGQLSEIEPGKAKIALRLPKDTNLSDLVYMNGQVLKQEVKE
jgi:hypothetical protein